MLAPYKQGGGTSEWKEIAERGNNACEPGKELEKSWKELEKFISESNERIVMLPFLDKGTRLILGGKQVEFCC